MNVLKCGLIARWVALVCLLSAASVPVCASVDKFEGSYEGTAVAGGDELSARDISVNIESKAKGFSLTWTAVIRKANGKVKRSEYSIEFLPTKRAGLYRSGMRRNLFGQAVPLDPLKGDPYVWAKVEDDTLVVHALLITEDGGYELQIYKRSLTPGGMHLDYFRIRDNEILRTVTGDLKKVD